MKIKWLGHASVLIVSDSGLRIITDPFRPGKYITPDGVLLHLPINERADIVAVSHDHVDHDRIGEVQGSPEVVRGDEIKGLGTNSWGMSASMGASRFYCGTYGSLPAGYRGRQLDRLTMDGTVASYGSTGFIVFTPEASISALEFIYAIPGLVGKYGLYDAYSFHTKADGDRPWVAETYLGIDKGIAALMLENYSTQLIWTLFHRNPYVQAGLENLEFRRTAAAEE